MGYCDAVVGSGKLQERLRGHPAALPAAGGGVCGVCGDERETDGERTQGR